MENEQDWKFDKDKASKALQTLSCHVNPFRDENVAELVRVISYCMDLEKALDKACEHFEVLDVIKEEVDNIQTVIDLLDSKVVTMGHINIAIKKLEIIQDKLMGVEEDAE